jgi:hypothetical protein
MNDEFGQRYLMCQDLVNAGVMSCDSGSPVFRRIGTGSEVELAGILWGGHPAGTAPGARFIFSRIGAIEQDFGISLDVVGTPPLQTEIQGPEVVCEGLHYGWSAGTTGGAPPYQHRWYRNGSLVHTGATYEETISGTSGFQLELHATDALNNSVSAWKTVAVQTGPGNPECPL